MILVLFLSHYKCTLVDLSIFFPGPTNDFETSEIELLLLPIPLMNSLIHSTLRPALLLRSGQPGGNLVAVCRQFRVAVVAMMEETKSTHYVRVR